MTRRGYIRFATGILTLNILDSYWSERKENESTADLSNVEATEWNCSAIEADDDRASNPAAWGDGVLRWPRFSDRVGAGGAGRGRFWMLRVDDGGRSSTSSSSAVVSLWA